jgi:hypothetical protein
VIGRSRPNLDRRRAGCYFGTDGGGGPSLRIPTAVGAIYVVIAAVFVATTFVVGILGKI